MINSYSGQSVSRSVWVLLFFGFFTATNAATQQYSRFEVGAAFSGFQMLDNVGNPPFNYGLAGQFDWNVSRRFAFETQIAFFPKSLSPPVPEQGGRTLQVLAGVRGRIFQRRRFALYGVVRPGITHSTNALTALIITETSTAPPTFFIHGKTGGTSKFTLDLGGGAEFYPTSRLILRTELHASPDFIGNTPLRFTTPPPTTGFMLLPPRGEIFTPWRIDFGLGYRLGKLNDISPQSGERGRLELGAQFSSLSFAWVDGVDHAATQAGVGFFLSYPILRFADFDSTVAFFPKNEDTSGPRDGGRILAGLFGAKVGIRDRRIGLFVKARPGFLSYSGTLTGTTVTPPPFTRTLGRATDFAMDLGGVVEVYPRKSFLVRIDTGDTSIFTRKRKFDFNGSTFTMPGVPRRNSIQLAVGCGWQF